MKLISSKIKTEKYLINSIFDKNSNTGLPKHSLFVGAGCSISSNLPSGYSLMFLLKQLCFSKEYEFTVFNSYVKYGVSDFTIEFQKKILDVETKNDQFKNFIVEKEKGFCRQVDLDSEFWINSLGSKIEDKSTKTKIWEEYSQYFYDSSLYGFWFDSFSKSSKDRQYLIEDIIDKKEPNGGYLILAMLIKENLFNNIYTTNFDDLINDALIKFSNLKSRIYAHNEVAKFIDFDSKRPNIIKLHGDYLFEDIKNTIAETSELESIFSNKFSSNFEKLGIIVLGYGGNDISIISKIIEAKKNNTKNPFHLIWCGSNPDSLSPRVVKLLNETENSFFVKIESFDEIICKIWAYSKIKFRGLDLYISPTYINYKNSIQALINKILAREKFDESEMSFLKEQSKSLDLFVNLSSTLDPTEKINILTNRISELKNHYLYFYRGIAYFERAQKYNDIENLKQSIDDFSEFIKTDKHNHRAYYYRACGYYKLKFFDLAITDFDNSIALYPNDYLAYNNKGLAYMRKGEFDLAEKLFLVSAKIQPENADVYNNLGVNCRLSGNYEKGLEFVEEGLKIDNKYSFLYGAKRNYLRNLIMKMNFYKNMRHKL